MGPSDHNAARAYRHTYGARGGAAAKLSDRARLATTSPQDPQPNLAALETRMLVEDYSTRVAASGSKARLRTTVPGDSSNPLRRRGRDAHGRLCRCTQQRGTGGLAVHVRGGSFVTTPTWIHGVAAVGERSPTLVVTKKLPRLRLPASGTMPVCRSRSPSSPIGQTL